MSSVLDQMLRKIETRAALDDDDRRALLGLTFNTRTTEPSTYLVREGELPVKSSLILSGLAYRQKHTVHGTRQIMSVNIPGDFVDMEGALLNVADHNVQALTRCEVAFIPRDELRAVIGSRPRVAMALWVDTLIDGAIFREWVLNVGRRDARGRISHLLCEFARRLQLAGLGEDDRYQLPMTQEQIADSTGLTAVHVNRVMKGLEREGLIKRSGRIVAIPDWEALRLAADFNETYLHLDQINGDNGRAANRNGRAN